MSTALVFGLALLAAVLASELADRSVLSTAVLFLAAGAIAGRLGFDVIAPSSESLTLVAELALVGVLFTDAMRVSPQDLRAAWRLPFRALLVGLPLTFAVTGLLAWGLTGLRLVDAALLAAVLAPTDPVFAAAIVGREDIPFRLRHLLNVESGLNDGLALPVVIVLIDVIAKTPVHPGALTLEALGGVALGGAIGVGGALLIKAPRVRATAVYQPLGTVAIAVVVFATAELTGANAFLAAFAAGIAVGALRGPGALGVTDLDESLAELLKLAALLMFGAVFSRSFLADFSPGDYVFVVAALLVARPAALAVAFLGSRLPRQQWIAAAWFGPKGFASVVYALLVLDAGLQSSNEIFHLAGAVVALSIIAHSSTDLLVARSLQRRSAPAPASRYGPDDRSASRS